MQPMTEIRKKKHHPTVKPAKLMQYLVRLVSPKGAIILDSHLWGVVQQEKQ